MIPGQLRLRVLPAAVRQTAEQAEYYLEQEGQLLADRWTDAVNDAISSLRLLPERGAPLNLQARALQNIRRLPITGFARHFLFYRLDVERGVLTVLSVLHGARETETHLRSITRHQ